ncbi:UNVERIFIED_CONTAM: hypothetical protein Sradi_2458300 [Sesamum radiatum]|uniref:Outer arm dynein light chain 1 protein n=1 Tax=Sesamum radiatum TaxID=300843 RepID=A0AAW2SJR7_SESRA
MGAFNCFGSSWRKKKDKVESSAISPSENNNDAKTLHVKLEHLKNCSETTELTSSSFSVPVPFSIPGGSTCKVKVVNHGIPVATDAGEADYEGGDEHDETLSMKRDNSDFDLQARVENSDEIKCGSVDIFCSLDVNHDNIQTNDTEEGVDTDGNGHVSDPGIGKLEFGPRQNSKDRALICADKVILKKHSSSQILPSGSRRLWWKLFLWSHRNLHRTVPVKTQPVATKPAPNQQGGYCSDTVEPRPAVELSKSESPSSFIGEFIDPGNSDINTQRWDGFYGFSGMWPQNQWVAFPTESSPLARVDEWVKEVSEQPSFQIGNDDQTEESVIFPPSPENGTSAMVSFHLTRHPAVNMPEDISHANSVIQSLNASSTVAYITGIGIKVIPPIAHFLASVHITPGSLPKGLHVLNLSRNKISTIEGLRELTRLRVLDLSYNRISRIGQGLSNCTLVKELYLSGNKISYVEGLHRLLKLTVLDLSFNKITTAKALGQLVANYNSLLALNLLGNPILSNISDDQLRKTCSLLPKLAFLNKQPVNPQKARAIGGNAIAKAALGSSSSGRNSRRKAVKRVNQGSSSSPSARRSSGSAAQKSSRQRTRSGSRYHSAAKDKM